MPQSQPRSGFRLVEGALHGSIACLKLPTIFALLRPWQGQTMVRSGSNLFMSRILKGSSFWGGTLVKTAKGHHNPVAVDSSSTAKVQLVSEQNTIDVVLACHRGEARCLHADARKPWGLIVQHWHGPFNICHAPGCRNNAGWQQMAIQPRLLWGSALPSSSVHGQVYPAVNDGMVTIDTTEKNGPVLAGAGVALITGFVLPPLIVSAQTPLFLAHLTEAVCLSR